MSYRHDETRERLQINGRRMNGYNIPYGCISEQRDNSGRYHDLFALAPRLRKQKQGTPLSVIFVDPHVLTEIIVAAKRLIAIRERTHKRWVTRRKLAFIVGLDQARWRRRLNSRFSLV